MEKYLLNNGNRLIIQPCESPSDPREWSNVGKMRIQEHRHYDFPNELGYDIDDINDRVILQKNYHIFFLDCYIHSGVSFSLTGRGMQCAFDTSKNCGFIVIPKEMNSYDNRAWSMSTEQDKGEKIIYTENEAMKIAELEIKTYNQYLNGDVYEYIIQEPVKRAATNKEGLNLEKTTYEYVDGCGDYYDVQDILEEHKLLDPKEID